MSKYQTLAIVTLPIPPEVVIVRDHVTLYGNVFQRRKMIRLYRERYGKHHVKVYRPRRNP